MNLENHNQKEDQLTSPPSNLEFDVLDELANLRSKIPYLDYLKSDYMFQADILMDALLDYKNNKTLNSKKEVERLSNNLINSKEELIRELIDYMNVINSLDHFVHRWVHQNE